MTASLSGEAGGNSSALCCCRKGIASGCGFLRPFCGSNLSTLADLDEASVDVPFLEAGVRGEPLQEPNVGAHTSHLHNECVCV